MIHSAKRESAVSPVIGTILLVAITVLLVAGILFLTGGFDTGDRKEVGLTAKSASGNDAQLLLYGGYSLSDLTRLEMIDQDSPNGHYVEIWNATSGSEPLVGYPYPVAGVAEPLVDMDVYDTRINVKGFFADGTEAILLVQPMTFQNVFASRSESTIWWRWSSTQYWYDDDGVIKNATFGSIDLMENENGLVKLPSDVLIYNEETGNYNITANFTMGLERHSTGWLTFAICDSQYKVVDMKSFFISKRNPVVEGTLDIICDPNGYVLITSISNAFTDLSGPTKDHVQNRINNGESMLSEIALNYSDGRWLY